MIINCKDIYEKWMADTKRAYPVHARLAIFMIGNDPASDIYVRNKVKDAEKLGYEAEVFRYDELADFSAIKKQMYLVAEDSKYHGMILQLPTPFNKYYQDILLNTIPCEKDVDGLSKESAMIPCTPAAILKLLEYELNVDLDGKMVVVLGRSELIGAPIAKLVQDKGATVAVCHSHTPIDIRNRLLAGADIVISAVGRPGLFTALDLSPETIVIDAGTAIGTDGKLHGDFNSSNADFMRITYTPVPGGVGLLTRAALMSNLAVCYYAQTPCDATEV